VHLNRLFSACFKPERFYEYARYDDGLEAIVVDLFSAEEQIIDLGALGFSLHLNKGDSIVIDHSCKFNIDSLTVEICELGYQATKFWFDPLYRYGAFLFQKK
jgi:uncharacterized SAM-dependent methyltransferase